MESIRKFLGVIWLILGPALIILMFWQFFQEVPVLKQAIAEGKKPASEMQSTYLFWIILIVIFVPISLGLTLFGSYALKGEYSKDVMSSADLSD